MPLPLPLPHRPPPPSCDILTFVQNALTSPAPVPAARTQVHPDETYKTMEAPKQQRSNPGQQARRMASSPQAHPSQNMPSRQLSAELGGMSRPSAAAAGFAYLCVLLGPPGFWFGLVVSCFVLSP